MLCYSHDCFSRSSTFQPTKQTLDFKRSPYGHITGEIGKDNIGLYGVSLGLREFGYSNNTSSFFDDKERGVYGVLGLKSSTKSGYESGLNRILKSVDRKLLTIYQKRMANRNVQHGAFIFGGFETYYCYPGKRQSIQLLNDELGLRFSAKEFSVRNKGIGSPHVYVSQTLDTHLFPEAIIENIALGLYARRIEDKYYVDCSLQNADFVFTNGKDEVKLPFNLFLTKLPNRKCVLNMEKGPRKSQFEITLSKRIFDEYCVTYDLDSRKVVFTERKF